MLQLFHGSMSNELSLGPLSFFGELQTSVERAEGLFMNHEAFRAYKDGSFLLVDRSGHNIIGREHPEETLRKFADFMERVSIKAFNLDIRNPLRLFDCWEDDPIGSGAMQIFNENSGLNQAQLQSLEKLFYPYEDVIYPEHVALLSSAREIKAMLDDREADPVFQNELEKRRVRSEEIGIPFNMAAAQEIVWTSLTVKLLEWAKEEGFDAFVYEGAHEGKKLDSYVVFESAQISEGDARVSFKKDDFLKVVLPTFSEYLKRLHSFEQGHSTDIFWAGSNPLEYWELT